MKKAFFKYIPLVLGLALTFTACKKDDKDDDNPFTAKNKNPKIEYTIGLNGTVNQASYQVEQGSEAKLYLKVNQAPDGGKLDKIELTYPAGSSLILNSANSNYILVTGISMDIDNKDNNELIATSNPLPTVELGSTTYGLKVVDKDGNSTTISFILEVVEPEGDDTPFTVNKTGQIYHIGGKNEGSWSIDLDEEVRSANKEDAEIQNTDLAGDPFTGAFKVGSNLTNVSFVKDNSYDYDNATVESADAAFVGGTSVTSESSPSVGDVYIFDVNGDYVVVKITEIDASNNDCECGNTGRMSFSYKK